MSQNNYSGGKDRKFHIDLDDDDDDLDFPSDDEVEISEDQRIMDELVQREHERDLRAAENEKVTNFGEHFDKFR